MDRNYHMPGGTAPIDDETKDEVVRLTVDEEKRPHEIAEITGISEASVKRILTARDIDAVGSRTWMRRQETNATGRKPITPAQFETVKSRKAEGSNSGTVAFELGRELGEVNAAWSAPSYDYYLRNR